MLDTIVLTLDQRHFDVRRPELFSPSARGLLTQPYYSLGARGKFACLQNPSKKDLRDGSYKPRLTLTKRKESKGFGITLRIEFSAPKLLFGNNFDELDSHDLRLVLELLHHILTAEMGIKVSMGALGEASVSAIHYSKNVVLDEFTTCSMVMAELSRVDLTKRLDLSHTDYRNEGHAIRCHADSFELVFYDKLRDLERARYSERRGIERDYGNQLLQYRRENLRKGLEILRIEVRLSKRAKIKSVFRRIGISPEIRFESLFDAAHAKKVLAHFWNEVRSQLPNSLEGRSPEDVIVALAAAGDGKLRPSKLLQQLGSVTLVESIGFRAAGALMSRHCSPRSWQRYRRELKSLPAIGDNRFSALQQIDEALARFTPLRTSDFSVMH